MRVFRITTNSKLIAGKWVIKYIEVAREEKVIN